MQVSMTAVKVFRPLSLLFIFLFKTCCRKQIPKLCEPGLDPGKVHQVYHEEVEEVLESTFNEVEEILAEKVGFAISTLSHHESVFLC